MSIAYKPGHCACGAPATHFFGEGKPRSRAITRACCGCYDREMQRVVIVAGQCSCGHPTLFHDEGGCRMAWCDCEKEHPAEGLPGRGG